MCPIEELEAWVAGRLPTDEAARVAEHAASCDECRAELEWLRTEAELMARRRQAQAEPQAALWDAIAARIDAGSAAQGSELQTTASGVTSLAQARDKRDGQRWGWGERLAYGGLVVAAAAAAVFAVLPTHGPVAKDVTAPTIIGTHVQSKKEPASVTFDRAELEYRQAAATLEAQYQEERPRLPPSVAERYDAIITQTRTRVADARQAAGNDVDGRMIVLDGYAEYLRSLQTIVTDLR